MAEILSIRRKTPHNQSINQLKVVDTILEEKHLELIIDTILKVLAQESTNIILSATF